jgi:hypothetical protein
MLDGQIGNVERCKPKSELDNTRSICAPPSLIVRKAKSKL